jgi:hypothetical protein
MRAELRSKYTRMNFFERVTVSYISIPYSKSSYLITCSCSNCSKILLSDIVRFKFLSFYLVALSLFNCQLTAVTC